MKFLGTNRPGTARAPSFIKFSWGRIALVAAACSTLAGIAACIPAGDCTGDCADTVGTTGGSSGSGGRPSGGSGGGGGGGDILSKAVENCGDFPTIGEVETKLIKVKCGDPAGCHGTSGPFAPNLKAANSYERIFDKEPITTCMTDKLIDPNDWAKSSMVTKLGDTPKCTNGDDGGAKMPFNKPALSASETTCIEEYVKAVIAAKKM